MRKHTGERNEVDTDLHRDWMSVRPSCYLGGEPTNESRRSGERGFHSGHNPSVAADSSHLHRHNRVED